MAKSYKICLLKDIKPENITSRPYFFGRQGHFKGIERPASTSIYLANKKLSVKNFVQYTIEHELEEHVIGRISGGMTFSAYIRTGHIDSFVNRELKVVLLSGKKKDVLDFCKTKKGEEIFSFNTIKIDMKRLLELLPHVKGVWFSFPEGQIRASALMGHDVNGTPDFKHFRADGEISMLTFQFLKDDILHPVMVTDDGAVVVQSNYRSVSEEISLVLAIKDQLLSKIIEETEEKK